MTEKIFFLGGHDLEMTEIRKLLEASGIRFYDRNLAWDNAFLSAYESEIRSFGTGNRYVLYGVELKTDIVAPANYHWIDHHNEHAGNKCFKEGAPTAIWAQ